jgi:hypothetical protein
MAKYKTIRIPGVQAMLLINSITPSEYPIPGGPINIQPLAEAAIIEKKKKIGLIRHPPVKNSTREVVGFFAWYPRKINRIRKIIKPSILSFTSPSSLHFIQFSGNKVAYDS